MYDSHKVKVRVCTCLLFNIVRYFRSTLFYALLDKYTLLMMHGRRMDTPLHIQRSVIR